jgi:hypothetical protein
MMRRIAYSAVAAAIAITVSVVYGQSADVKPSLQQSLTGQFALTKVSDDRNDIVTAGSVLVLQKDGLMMYSTASPMPPLNTYKNGRISQGMGGFGRDLAIGLATPGGGTSEDYPHRKFVTGEKFWLTAFNIGKDGIVFQLYSDPYNDVRYYGQLKVPLDKRSVPSADDALARIAEVLTVQPPDNSETPPPSESVDPGKGVLQNEDILKMAKAGLDDSIIIAKIKSSKCQFDTAPDTLIELKQSGVSSTVLRAMTEAPNPQ